MRFFILLGAVCAALTFSAVALAGAHFMSTSSSVDGAGALNVSFTEAGLGNGNINYTLDADATATYACINGGGKHPSAANKETNPGHVTGGADFQSKNGRVSGSVSAGPIDAGSFSCPGGQRLVLASVSYSNIVLTDTTSGVSTGFDDTSRTFFDV
jgi:hypothetical protein